MTDLAMMTDDEEAESQDTPIDMELAKANIGQTLMKKFQVYSDQRIDLEKRWLDNLRAYNNRYDGETEAKLTVSRGSKVYIGLVRKYTEGFASRLAGAAMPTDGRNWAARPTPIPEVQDLEGDKSVLTTTPEGAPLTGEDLHKAVKEVSEKRGNKMEMKMEDQLAECDWNSELRLGIDDASIYGVMAMDGPLVKTKSRTGYKQIDAIDKNNQPTKVYVAAPVVKQYVAFERVSPWDCYWDQAVEQSRYLEDWFRRYRMNDKQVRELAKQPGMDTALIEEILEGDKKTAGQMQPWENQVREITKQNNIQAGQWSVLKYVGPLGKEEIEACKTEVELDKANAIVWLLNGKVIKIEPVTVQFDNNLNLNMCAPFPDGVGICGFGVPELAGDVARAVNATCRAILDHSAQAAVPMRVINTSGVKGADGNLNCYPGKEFLARTDVPGFDASKMVFNIVTPVNLQAFYSAYELFYKLMDDVTMLPQLSQGFESHTQQTARESTIRSNAANETLRRVLKRLEDGVVDGCLTGLYHYNMQLDDDESIKGDMEVVTMGVQALQEAESQGQWYAQMMNYVLNPQTSGYFNRRPFLEGMAKGQRINPDTVIASDEDIKRFEEERAKAAQTPQQQDPRLQIAQMNNETKKMEIAAKKEVDTARLELMKHAEEMSGMLQLESLKSADEHKTMELQAKLATLRQTLDAQAKKHNMELAVEAPHPRLA